MAALLPLAGSNLLAVWAYGFHYAFAGVLFDALVSISLMLILRLVVRSRLAAWLLGCAIAFLPLANAIKVGFLGLPILASDIGSGIALLRVLHGWRLVLALAGALILLVPLLWALWPRSKGGRGLVAAAAFLGLIFISALVWGGRSPGLGGGEGRVEQLRNQGAYLYFANNAADLFRSLNRAEGREEVLDAMKDLGIQRVDGGEEFKRRNVHLVLLESLWDPLALKHYEFSRDPFDPRFRRLLEQADNSSAMVPTFGGATANAEFEMLCGLPAADEFVVFQDLLKQSIPCLPSVLRSVGYKTIASHPYRKDFWSRNVAYPRVGFEFYDPDSAFDLEDMDGSFQNDASTFKQVRNSLLNENNTAPIFQYVVSLSSHYPYSRNRAVRPDLVTVNPKSSLLEDYANAIAYSTSAFMDYVEAIHALDPDALIVAVGDHAPVLGTNPDPYALSGISLSNAADLADALPIVSHTPLLILDGTRGPVRVGEVPLRALPSLILQQLGEGAPELPYSGEPQKRAEQWRSRVFQNELLVEQGDTWISCAERESSPAVAEACIRANETNKSLLTLRQDIAQGKQYALSALGVPPLGADGKMTTRMKYDACGMSVKDWGPKFTSQGEPFNVQKSGKSTFWFALEHGRGELSLIFDNQSSEFTIDGKAASASAESDGFLASPGEYPLQWKCADGTMGEIGTFMVIKKPETMVGTN